MLWNRLGLLLQILLSSFIRFETETVCWMMSEESFKEACLLVLSFLIGAYACGLLIDKNQVHFLGKAFYGLALVLNSSLLVSAAFIPGRLLPVCLVAAACGLQNAMCTSHFGAIIRTTHVTGTVTDIGSTLGRISMIYLRKGCHCSQLNDIERAEVGVDARKLAVLFGLWSFYFMGGLFGVYMEPGLHLVGNTKPLQSYNPIQISIMCHAFAIVLFNMAWYLISFWQCIYHDSCFCPQTVWRGCHFPMEFEDLCFLQVYEVSVEGENFHSRGVTSRLRKTLFLDLLNEPCCCQPLSLAVWVSSTWYAARCWRWLQTCELVAKCCFP